MESGLKVPSHKRYVRLKEKGVCVHCGTRKAEIGVACHRCRALKLNLYYKRKEEGICVHCGIPLIEEETTRCINCAEQITLLDGGRI